MQNKLKTKAKQKKTEQKLSRNIFAGRLKSCIVKTISLYKLDCSNSAYRGVPALVIRIQQLHFFLAVKLTCNADD